MAKIKELAVKVGTNKDGKAKWKNVGGVFEGPRGNYIMLDKTFNPAGVPSDSDIIFISMFDPKPKENAGLGFNDADEVPF